MSTEKNQIVDLGGAERDKRWIGIVSKLEPKDLGEACALLAAPEDEVIDFLSRCEALIEAAKIRQRATGAHRPRLAGRLVDRGLQRLHDELDSADIKELPGLLKPALAVLDQEQRRLAKLDELAQMKAQEANLPLIEINRGDVTITFFGDRKAKAEPIDVETRVLKDVAEGEL